MNFSFPQKINLVGIPGTPYLALADDSNLTPKAMASRSIIIEKEIEALPEVKALKACDVVYDIGAFIGDTTLIFAEKGCRVIAFEPQLDAYLAAVHNLRSFQGVTLFNRPVGSGRPVCVNQDPMGQNFGTRTVSACGSAEMHFVADKLDWYVRELPVPNFIKIDVEGFEADVVFGAQETLRKHKPKLLIEIYPEMLLRNGSRPADVIEPLKAIGYTCREVIGNSTEPRWDIFCEIK